MVKLENARTGGDVTRKWKLPSESAEATVSAYFSSVNHGKEHHLVDLAGAEGRALLDSLVTRADVLITNHLADDAEKLGLERERLRSLNPRLLHGHVRGYELDRSRPAFDVVLQAEAGYISMTGSDVDHPAKLPIAMIDLIAAHQLKEGLMLALYQRERSGKGAYVEISLEKAALTGLINQASNWLMAGHEARPIGTLHPNIAPYGELFTCADGERIVLAVGSQAQFAALCEVIGSPELALDVRFATNAVRVVNRTALANTITMAIAQRPRNEWLTLLTRAQVPAGAVNCIAEALSTPTAKAMTLTSRIDGMDTMRISGNAFTIEPY